ncbi:hypothetical protein MKK69_08130 [Methylobacterium sp. J-026]|uniref:hypothetical protein n=1 Tax=Methylobacterium sp. J-026 TaxID=2836624 RepID=UPI001FB93080|nr:hypothetical protein [Methylobacterium sp. J-026]MCJ2134033.1 hypothetical protein [Methylobacterium sp. J-026]
MQTTQAPTSNPFAALLQKHAAEELAEFWQDLHADPERLACVRLLVSFITKLGTPSDLAEPEAWIAHWRDLLKRDGSPADHLAFRFHPRFFDDPIMLRATRHSLVRHACRTAQHLLSGFTHSSAPEKARDTLDPRWLQTGFVLQQQRASGLIALLSDIIQALNQGESDCIHAAFVRYIEALNPL